MIKKSREAEAMLIHCSDGSQPGHVEETTGVFEAPQANEQLAQEIMGSLAEARRVLTDATRQYEGCNGDDDQSDFLNGFSFKSRP